MKGYIQALIDSQNRRLNRATSSIIRYEIEDRIEELKAIQEYLNKKEIIEVKQKVPSFFIKSTGEKIINDLERELRTKYVKNL